MKNILASVVNLLILTLTYNACYSQKLKKNNNIIKIKHIIIYTLKVNNQERYNNNITYYVKTKYKKNKKKSKQEIITNNMLSIKRIILIYIKNWFISTICSKLK